MNRTLKAVAAGTLFAITAPFGGALAEDVWLMDGVTARTSNNPLVTADRFRKAPPWVIGMSHFGVNANTWTVQVAHESQGAAKKTPASLNLSCLTPVSIKRNRSPISRI